jgi:hypothetical protein
MHLGISLRFLRMGHLPYYVMMFTGQEDIASYGQLIKADEHANIGLRPHMLQCLPVGEGLLVLAAQDRFLRFLCACVRQILHDVPDVDLTNGPKLPAPILSDKTDTGFASLAVMAAEAPYRLPRQLDLDRMVSLLAAKRSQAADHLRSLREDPGYFHRRPRLMSKTLPNTIITIMHQLFRWTLAPSKSSRPSSSPQASPPHQVRSNGPTSSTP